MKKSEIKQTEQRQGTARHRIFLFGCIFSTLILFSACQKDDGEKGKTNVPTAAAVVVNNNSSELSKRITVYAHTQNAKGNTHVPLITMPAPPDMSKVSGYSDMSQGYTADKVKPKAAFYLPKGKELTTSINVANNTTYYIDGELTISGLWGNSGDIIVLPNGKLNYNVEIPNNLIISNYGELLLSNSTTIRGELRTVGSIETGSITVDNSGILYASGKIAVATLANSENSIIQSDCSILIENDFTLNNNSTVIVTNYLAAPSIAMNSAAVIAMKSGSLVKTKKIDLSNPSCVVTVFGDEYAVLAADEIVIHQQNVKRMFTGWLDIHYTTLTNRSGKDLDWLSNIKFNGNTYLPENGECQLGFGEPTESEKSYELDHLAEIASPDHQHNISATSIQVANGRAYVSYHTHGDDYGGCLEVIEMVAEQCKIQSFLEAKGTLDFNHLLAEENQVWVVGGERKGAFMANIDLKNGSFATEQTSLNKYRLEGNSGNCIIRNGDFLITASNAGFETFDAANLTNPVTFLATPGSAKFLHQGTGPFATLSLSDKNETESTAELKTYSETDRTLTAPAISIAAGSITPTNGKNVVKTDGETIYVCLGQNGIKAFKNGVEQGSFKLDVVNGEAANGLDVDAQFVYVAYGTGGLYVLDKSDLSVVASYKHAGGKSANYVTVATNGYIYVAYGLNGLQIFRLVEVSQ